MKQLMDDEIVQKALILVEHVGADRKLTQGRLLFSAPTIVDELSRRARPRCILSGRSGGGWWPARYNGPTGLFRSSEWVVALRFLSTLARAFA
ncbi:hypothetical protein ACS77_02080 [Pseudomonas syringae]|uniref:Uncharacterized protein n=1 Tax=Pseudomonas syringae TaxID=317 RepID=A0A0L1MLX5_PSESX|nr:hypothetical protein ACS77_02080 [Pseudomonas syringae]